LSRIKYNVYLKAITTTGETYMSGILVMSMILSVAGGELPYTSDTYLLCPRERVRDTDTVFTMPHYDLASWEATAAKLRDRVLLGNGLYPMPEKTPLNANVFDETEQDGYKVAKVHFEAWPGFFSHR
jgi:hypothetical protein